MKVMGRVVKAPYGEYRVRLWTGPNPSVSVTYAYCGGPESPSLNAGEGVPEALAEMLVEAGLCKPYGVLAKDFRNLYDDHVRLSGVLAQKQKEHCDERRGLLNVIEELDRKVSSLMHEHSAQEVKIQSLKEVNADLERGESRKSAAVVNDLKGRLEDSEAIRKEQVPRLNTLQHKVDVYEDAIQQKNQKIQAQQEKIKNLEDKASTAERLARVRWDVMEDCHSQIEEWRARYKKVVKENGELKLDVAVLKARPTAAWKHTTQHGGSFVTSDLLTHKGWVLDYPQETVTELVER